MLSCLVFSSEWKLILPARPNAGLNRNDGNNLKAETGVENMEV